MEPTGITQETSVTAALSTERLAPYLRAMNGDHVKALELYEWNLVVSSAFFEMLAVLEVVLRNALSERLALRHGSLPGHWYENTLETFSAQASRDIVEARRRVALRHHRESSGRVVAELNFGFWKFLLAKRYEATLWTHCLRHAFPHLGPQSRAIVYGALDELHALRNRIAHHEPIHARDLSADVLTISRVLGWIDPHVRDWALGISRVVPLISVRPSSPRRLKH